MSRIVDSMKEALAIAKGELPETTFRVHIPATSDACRMMLTKIAREKRLPFASEEPNELTRRTLEMTDRGEDVYHAKDLQDLLVQLRS